MTILYAVIAFVVLLASVMAINTIYKKSKKEMKYESEKLPIDSERIARNLSGMIKFRTITSDKMEGFDREAFLGLHKYLEETYPLIHSKLEREIINEYSLLYKWKGDGSGKKPFLMMAHMDVVPVDEGMVDRWEHEAFLGDIADGYVWGRGAIDMKGQIAAIMESVEYLLAKGFEPDRDIYIALGHDEERMGVLGAKRIAQRLKEKGIRFDFVIDEGGVVMNGKMLGVNAMIATIGICEKGYADVRLTAESKGGHASRPPKQTAVGVLAKAIVALEKKKMKPFLNTPLRQMLGAIGGYMKFPLNVIAANLFITKPLLIKGLASSPTGSAMVRTTTAPTMLKGSAAPNVLAEKAEAVVNFRISPDDSLKKLLEHVSKVAGSGIKVELIEGHEPSPVSRTDTEGYRIISQTIEKMFGGYVVTPYLMVAATDSRWYADIADGVYRFQPFKSLDEDLNTIHAAGERLKTESLCEGVEFFIRLVKNAAE